MVTARIDISGLQRDLDTFKGRFDTWAQESVTSTESVKEEHFKRLREFQSAIRDLHKQETDLNKQAEEVKLRLQSEHEQQDELQIELDRVSAQQAALPGLISEVRVALAAETVKAERQAAALADQDSAKQRKLGALQQALQMYRDRLGLVFEQAAEEQLVLVFTHVDARDPARRFEFAVQVLEDDSYQVRRCEPPVAALPALLEQLNASNDFSAFVRAMRREFARLAAAEGQP